MNPGSAQAARTVPSGKRRNSCDVCTKRKKKCDGNGVHPCSVCVARNEPCHYSVRLLTGPRAASASKRASKGAGSSGNGGSGGLASTGDRYSAVVPLKRARLSPSAATGLIGMRENVFIGQYFRAMGILPFTNESFIRKAMVSTVFRTMQEQDPGFPGYPEDSDDREEKGGLVAGDMVHTTGGGDGFIAESKVESAAAACVLWSTIGVGCLIGGHPKSSVEGYAQLARDALAVCFDDESVETARAYTAMALFQNFLGKEDLFNKYTQYSKSIMSTLPPKEVPVDLTDSHLFVKACDVVGSQEEFDENVLRDIAISVANGYESCTNMVKDPRIFQRSELCRWLLKTDIRMAACFAMDMYDAFSQGASLTPGRVGGAIGVDDGGDELSTTNVPHAINDDEVAEENDNTLENSPQPPPPGKMSQKFAADV